MSVDLYHAWISPWSERARWVLDAAQVAHRKRAYIPFFGEPALRLRLGKLAGRLTIPVMVTDEGVLFDSLEIGRWAHRARPEADLFPPGREEELLGWHAAAETLCSAARSRTTRRLAADTAARKELLPPSLARLGPLAAAMTGAGTRMLSSKYGLASRDAAEDEAEIRRVLQRVRDTLSDGRSFLLSSFSWADIVLASGMQGVRPVEHPKFRVGPKTRATWTEPELSREFADVLAWRDAVYAARR